MPKHDNAPDSTEFFLKNMTSLVEVLRDHMANCHDGITDTNSALSLLATDAHFEAFRSAFNALVSGGRFQVSMATIPLATDAATQTTLLALYNLLLSVVSANKVQVAGTVTATVSGVATDAKLDLVVTALGALNTLLTTANSLQTTANSTLSTISSTLTTMSGTLSTMSSTLTGIKTKTDGLNFSGQNLKVTGLL